MFIVIVRQKLKFDFGHIHGRGTFGLAGFALDAQIHDFVHTFTGQFFDVDRSDVLDSGALVPLAQSVLAPAVDHSVEHAIEEVLTKGRSGLTFGPRDQGVDNASEADVAVHLIGYPQSTELFDTKIGVASVFGFRELFELFGRAEVDL